MSVTEYGVNKLFSYLQRVITPVPVARDAVRTAMPGQVKKSPSPIFYLSYQPLTRAQGKTIRKENVFPALHLAAPLQTSQSVSWQPVA